MTKKTQFLLLVTLFLPCLSHAENERSPVLRFSLQNETWEHLGTIPDHLVGSLLYRRPEGEFIITGGNHHCKDSVTQYSIKQGSTEPQIQASPFQRGLSLFGEARSAIFPAVTYIFGGISGSISEPPPNELQSHDEIWSLNEVTGGLQLVARLPQKLLALEAFSQTDGSILLLGGETITEDRNLSVFRFNPIDASVTLAGSVPSDLKYSVPEIQISPTRVVLRKPVYWEDTVADEVVLLDFGTGEVRNFGLPPIPISSEKLVHIDQDRVAFFGGISDPQGTSTDDTIQSAIQILDLTSGEWDNSQSLPIAGHRITAISIGQGRVLITGLRTSRKPSYENYFRYNSLKAFIYESARRMIRETTPLPTHGARLSHRFFPDGTLMLWGGWPGNTYCPPLPQSR